jgi:hypothetical protein
MAPVDDDPATTTPLLQEHDVCDSDEGGPRRQQARAVALRPRGGDQRVLFGHRKRPRRRERVQPQWRRRAGADGIDGRPTPLTPTPHSTPPAELGPATPKMRIPAGTTHWLLTTCILLGDMFGLGSLTLPADFVRLGWVPALALLILFGIGDVYSGLLYTRLLVALPDVVVFDQIGAAQRVGALACVLLSRRRAPAARQAGACCALAGAAAADGAAAGPAAAAGAGERAMGKLGKALVFGTVYLTIAAEPIIFHLICVEALQQVGLPCTRRRLCRLCCQGPRPWKPAADLAGVTTGAVRDEPCQPSRSPLRPRPTPRALQMFYSYGLTAAAASLIVSAMALPLAQMQHMHDLGWVALAGTIGALQPQGSLPAAAARRRPPRPPCLRGPSPGPEPC